MIRDEKKANYFNYFDDLESLRILSIRNQISLIKR